MATSASPLPAADSPLPQLQLQTQPELNGPTPDQQGSLTSVYFDTDSGIWKCRHCCWNYKTGNVIDDIQNCNGHVHVLMHAKSLNQTGPTLISPTQGSELTNGISGTGHSVGVQSSASDKNLGDTRLEVTGQHADIESDLKEGKVKDDRWSGSRLQPSKFSFEETNKALESEDVDLIKESDLEITELDAEELLKEQDTHEISVLTKGISGKGHSIGVDCSAFDKHPGDSRLEVTVQHEDIEDGLTSVINRENEGKLKDDRWSAPRLQPSEISFEETDSRFKSSNGKAVLESEDTDPTNDSDLEIKELDVEEVLKKQNTHDLYCPNCNSCITRRVILRKRKRRVRTSSEDGKRNKLVTNFGPELGDDSGPVSDILDREVAEISLDDSRAPALNDSNRDREPDIFRCLACLSFFMPTGSGFKLFRIFGDRSDREEVQDRQQTPTNKNWFSSIFASDKGKMLVKQGSRDGVDGDEKNVGAIISSSDMKDQNGQTSSSKEAPSTSEITKHMEAGDDIATSPTQGSLLHDKMVVDGGDRSDDAIISFSSVKYQSGQTSSSKEAPSTSGITKHMEAGDDIAASSTQGSLLHEKMMVDGGDKSDDAIQRNKGEVAPDHSDGDTITGVTGLRSLSFSKEMLLNDGNNHPVTEVAGRTSVNDGKPAENENSIPQEDGFKLPLPSNVESIILEKSQTTQKLNVEIRKSSTDGIHSFNVPQHIISTNVDIHTEESLKLDKTVIVAKDLKNAIEESGAGKDTIITVEVPFEPIGAQTIENVIVSSGIGSSPRIEAQIHVAEQRATEAREVNRVDIIKSIVYGGLIESMTSLGVVSSAASAEAATVNILAFGLANLIGGLFVLGHDLWELKSNQSGGATNGTTGQIDRYQEILGQRKNFPIHAVVAVASFLIFGLVPPVTYGFSFRKSNDRDLKLIAVAAAALVCIFTLATGKAYAQRPHRSYFKTILYYLTMGFMTTGVSYAFGHLIKRLLEKLGLFHSSSAVTLPFHETNPSNLAWASY